MIALRHVSTLTDSSALTTAFVSIGHLNCVFWRVLVTVRAIFNGQSLLSKGRMRGTALFASRSNTYSACKILAEGYSLKVLRIDTTSDPAKMINLHTVWNWRDKTFVRESMRQNILGFYRKYCVSRFFAASSSSSPKPTSRVWLWRNEVREALDIIASRHVALLWSRCLGLHGAYDAVAARFYFPTQNPAVQV